MGYIQQNNDEKFDFDLSNMNKQININEAFKNEQPSLEILNDFLNSKIEVKCQNTSIFTNNVYIEYQISKWDKETKKHKKFENSGILTSNSDYYVLTCYDMITVVPTAYLKYLYANKKRFSEEHGEELFSTKDSHVEYNPIARGMVIKYPLFMQLYLQWLNTPNFVQYRLNKMRK